MELREEAFRHTQVFGFGPWRRKTIEVCLENLPVTTVGIDPGGSSRFGQGIVTLNPTCEIPPQSPAIGQKKLGIKKSWVEFHVFLDLVTKAFFSSFCLTRSSAFYKLDLFLYF